MKKYERYKDSGVEWLGEIPEHWKVMMLKNLFSFNKGLSITKSDLVENGTPVISYGQIHSKANTGTTVGESLLRYVPSSFTLCNENSLTQIGDFIFADTSEDLEGCGNCVYIDKDGIYAGYHTIILRSKKIENNKFLSYLFLTDLWRNQIRSSVNGVKVFSITQTILSQTSIILPTVSEQEQIVKFLDSKTNIIDSIISEKQSLIDDLQGYRMSIITEAVTHGLNPDTPMKDSGVEWFGEIPKHWKVMKTLYCLSMPITDGPHTTPDFYDKGIPFISAEAVSSGNGYIDFSRMRGYISEDFYYECCKKYIPQRNDIFMIKSGATTGKVAIVNTDKIFTIWSPLAVFRCNNDVMYSKYMYYLLQSSIYQLQVQTGWSFGTQQNIGMRTLEKILIPVPLTNEQQNIVSYLDSKIEKISASISELTSQIKDLQDYRSALITEAVTGKIDLREWKGKTN